MDMSSPAQSAAPVPNILERAFNRAREIRAKIGSFQFKSKSLAARHAELVAAKSGRGSGIQSAPMEQPVKVPSSVGLLEESADLSPGQMLEAIMAQATTSRERYAIVEEFRRGEVEEEFKSLEGLSGADFEERLSSGSNAERWEIAKRLNQSSPAALAEVASPKSDLSKLTVEELHARLAIATGNAERWELAAEINSRR